MLQRKSSALTTLPLQDDEEDSRFDYFHILNLLYREKLIILGAVAIALALSVLYLATATPMYSATTSLLIDPRLAQVLKNRESSDAPQVVDTSLVDSQVEILNSDLIAQAVIRKLDLVQDPEFVGAPSGPLGAVQSFARSLFGGLKDLFGQPPSPEVGEDAPERRALEAFAKHLQVRRIGLSYVIDITFSSSSPKRAAEVANAVAAAFFAKELAAQYDSNKQARDWLSQRLTELRSQTMAAELAVQVFKADNNIVDTSRGLMVQQQLAELNAQITAARAATAETKARLDRIQSLDEGSLLDVTVTDALTNAVITRLRAQYLDLSAREAALISQYGPDHIAVVKLHNEMTQRRKAIANELKRIADAYQNDYQIALARTQSLETSLGDLVAVSERNSRASVKLRDLESTADAYRSLYNNFLGKFQDSAQRESFPISGARVSAPAIEPLKKSSPKATLTLAIGLAAGLIAGVGTVLGREFLARGFRTPGQVERDLDVPCFGFLPNVIDGQGSRPVDAQQLNSGSYVVDVPFSRFAETLRNVKVSVDASNPSRACCVLGVTSVLPREGKSTVAVNLAQIVAEAGFSVLLIDSDLRVAALTANAAPHATKGLLEVIAGTARFEDVVQVDKSTGLQLIPAVTSNSRQVRSAEAVSSKAVQELLATARKTYDYVILDLPPLAPVVDVKAMAFMLDGILLVLHWNKTSRSTVEDVLTANEAVRQRLFGAVLNKVKREEILKMERERGVFYGDYYVE